MRCLPSSVGKHSFFHQKEVQSPGTASAPVYIWELVADAMPWQSGSRCALLCTVLGILRAALYSSVIWLEFGNLLALTRGIQYFIYHNCSISLFTLFSFSFPVWEVFAQPGNPSSTLLDSKKLIWQKLAARAQLCYVWIRPRIKPEVRFNCGRFCISLKELNSPERSMGLHYFCPFLANIAVVWDQIKV